MPKPPMVKQRIWWACPWFLLKPCRDIWIRVGVDPTGKIVERAIPIPPRRTR